MQLNLRKNTLKLAFNYYVLHFILMVLFLLLFLPPCVAQNFSDAKIKTAYIIQFAQNILWPNENELDTFSIVAFTEDQNFIKELNEISHLRTLKEKPVRVIYFNSVAQLKKPFPNLIYIDNFFGDLLPSISGLVGSDPILIVSDNSKMKDLVMINFIYTEEQRRRISFELNSSKIEEDNNLTILPRLLLLGGSKIDVAQLYLKQEEELKDEREKAESYRLEISAQEETIARQNSEIERQQVDLKLQKDELATQQKQMLKQQRNLDSLRTEIIKQQLIVNNNMNLLSKSKEDIDNQREQLNLQAEEMEKRNRILEVQNVEIQNQQERIENQKSVLDQQSKQIRTQRSLLIISVAAALMTLGMFFFMYKSFQDKKRSNKLLEEKNNAIQLKNNEIMQQKEEMQAQAELLANTNKELEKLSIVASKTDNGVTIVNSSGIIEWVNPGFTRLTGFTLEEIFTLKGNSIIKISSYELIGEVFEKCINTKESIIYENSFETKTNETIWLQTTLTPVLDSNGEVIKIVAIDSNITDLKRAHEDTINMLDEIISQAELIQKQNDEILAQREVLEKAQKQLLQSEKMASIGVLTAGIAHEINNPINFVYAGVNSIMRDFIDVDRVLKIIADLETTNLEPTELVKQLIEMKKEFEFDEAYMAIKQTINDILLGAQRTTEIVQGLRNFSRSEKEEFGFTNINKVIDGVLVLLRNKYKNHVEIIKNQDPNLPQVECKMGKMNQVLMNIISNAIDAIEEKGEIVITSKQVDDFCSISIKDNGIGMNEKVMSKIFDPFFTTKEVGKGTGLGLAITFGIIEEHNGKIDVKSEPGKGTEFTITIPIKQEHFINPSKS